MSDLIDRQAAIDTLTHEWDGMVTSVFDVVKSLPPAPQRTGRWIKHIDDLFPAESTLECSMCHHEQPITIDDNYCPNCGARMEGE